MDRLVIPKVGLSPSEKLYANGSSLHIESFRSLGIGQYFCNTSLCSSAILWRLFNTKSWKRQYISGTIICTNTTILLSSQKRWIMLRNNIELDVKVKCIEGKTTQAEIAKEINITPSYVNRLIRKNETVVNKTFLAMMESLGYDVELTYVKREE